MVIWLQMTQTEFQLSVLNKFHFVPLSWSFVWHRPPMSKQTKSKDFSFTLIAKNGRNMKKWHVHYSDLIVLLSVKYPFGRTYFIFKCMLTKLVLNWKLITTFMAIFLCVSNFYNGPLISTSIQPWWLSSFIRCSNSSWASVGERWIDSWHGRIYIRSFWIKRKRLYVVYFDQLSGACSTRKLLETFFSAIFWPLLFISKLF